MIRVTPFTFSYIHFENGVKKINKCLQMNEELKLGSKGLILISGNSGSGKSTLLNIIKGLIPIHIKGEFDGEVWIENTLLTKENVEKFNQKIVYLFQNPFSQLIHQDPTLEMAFTMENLKIPSDDFEKIKKNIITKLSLENRLDVYTNQLSNGECQKLVLGSLIAISPKVLLLDEPTAFLDPSARENFYSIIAKLKENHLIILVDHHVEEVLPIVDRVITVKNQIVYFESALETKVEVEQKNSSPIFPEIKEKIEFKLDKLSFSYNQERELLKNVSMQAIGGECIVIKGNNGLGKSTLFKIMAGLLPVKTGLQLKINNELVKKNKILLYSGFVFQNPESNFFFNTLAEEVSPLENTDLLKLFFNESDYNRSPYLFSEGQKRRISILINLALKKKILFLDEPTFGQDDENKKIIADIVLSLKKMGALVFMISHDNKFIQSVADRIFKLEDGTLEEIK